MSDIKRNERRRKHYQMLKEAGYDRTTATKLKDYDLFTVEQMCKIKHEAVRSVDDIDRKVQEEMQRVLFGKRGKKPNGC